MTDIADLVAKLDEEARAIDACRQRRVDGLCPECKAASYLVDVRRIVVAAKDWEAAPPHSKAHIDACNRLVRAVRGEA